MVSTSNQDDFAQSTPASPLRQPPISRRLLPPASGDPGLEQKRLGSLGCSHKVVQTLLQARKSSTNATYYRVWKKFTQLAESSQFNPLDPGVHNILLFLQSGLDLGLGLNTLKVQVSALSVLTDTRWALEPLVDRSLKAMLKLRPPRRTLYPKWDLTVVLNVLASPPFAPTEECALEDIAWKTTF